MAACCGMACGHGLSMFDSTSFFMGVEEISKRDYSKLMGAGSLAARDMLEMQIQFRPGGKAVVAGLMPKVASLLATGQQVFQQERLRFTSIQLRRRTIQSPSLAIGRDGEPNQKTTS